MEYRYHRQIFELLLPRKRKGMKLQAIAVFLYNENNTFFESSEEYERLYRSVQGYLLRQSRQKNGHFAKVARKRGWFRVRILVNKQDTINLTHGDQ